MLIGPTETINNSITEFYHFTILPFYSITEFYRIFHVTKVTQKCFIQKYLSKNILIILRITAVFVVFGGTGCNSDSVHSHIEFFGIVEVS